VLEQDGLGHDRAQTSMSSESYDGRNEMKKGGRSHRAFRIVPSAN